MSVFKPVATFLATGAIANTKIERFNVSDNDAFVSSLRGNYVPAGEYTRLYVDGQLMMSDTLMEEQTNRPAVYNAKGKVLIAGLGLGFVLRPILCKESVTEVVVVEKSQEVIDLVLPSLLKNIPEAYKLTVVHADAFEWLPEKGVTFDLIYFDIWPDIATSNLKRITKLKRHFSRHKSEGCEVLAWQEGNLRRRERKERKERKAKDARFKIRLAFQQRQKEKEEHATLENTAAAF